MIFEALEPLHITTRSLGEVSLSPGDRLDWPDQAVKMLMAQYPESVRVVHDLPFQVHDRVTYQVPIIAREPRQYTWASHRGVILAVSAFAEMVCIQPEDEPETPWRWLWRGYVEKPKYAQE